MPTIEIIQNLQRFEHLKTDWNELQRRAKLGSPFLSHQWFRACARSLFPHQELLLFALREGKELIGVAPLLRERVHVRGLPVEQIGFLENPLSPFADFLLLDPKLGLNLILEHLFHVYTNWDILTLNRLREDSPNLNIFCSLLSSHSSTYHKRVTSRTPYLLIDRPWEEFYK